MSVGKVLRIGICSIICTSLFINQVFGYQNTIPFNVLSKTVESEMITEEINFQKNGLDYLKKGNPGLFSFAKSGMIFNPVMEGDLVLLAKAYKEKFKVPLNITSAYRSIKEQEKLYNNFKKRGLKDFAAEPGRSEHHLGTAIDFGLSGNKIRYQWLSENAYKYGFIQSFTADCKVKTGVNEEAWHYRYIGVENAILYKNTFDKKKELGEIYCSVDFLREMNMNNDQISKNTSNLNSIHSTSTATNSNKNKGKNSKIK